MKLGIKLVMVTVTALLASLLSPTPAMAAGSFSWSFSGDYGVYSRDFYQPRERDIYVKVSSWSPCSVNSDRVTIYFYLYKNDTFDNQVGERKEVDCTGTVKWSLVNPGTYYWRLLIEGQHRDQPNLSFKGSGTTYYDGSTP